MKIRTEEDLIRYETCKQYEQDKYFVRWITDEELPIYKKAMNQFSNGKVMIHFYPYATSAALLKLGTDADVREFLKVIRELGGI